MLRKVIAGAITAGAISVPLAGMAWADAPTDHGNNGHSTEHSNGVGHGGVPGRLGNLNGTPDTPLTPGHVIRDLRQTAQDQGDNNLPAYLRSQTTYTSPGQIVSGVAHGNLTPQDLQDLLNGSGQAGQ